MDEDTLHALYELFPNSEPEYLLQVLHAHDCNLSAAVETLLGHSEPVEVIRPPSPWREPTRINAEVAVFKRDLGRMLQGDSIEPASQPLSARLKCKLKQWFSRRKKPKEEEKDAASTVSPSEPDEEVISFYAPAGLRKGEHPPPDIGC